MWYFKEDVCWNWDNNKDECRLKNDYDDYIEEGVKGNEEGGNNDDATNSIEICIISYDSYDSC